MKNKIIKIFLFFVSIIFIYLINSNLSYAATQVTDETSLNDAISSADSGSTITLQNNITVTKPIVIAKELTINGNGYTISGDSSWTSTSGNQSMFTAQLADATLTLKNINLANGPKYGVQSYDGASVILDNVSITGFRYGGVLVNGGNIEIRKLHLGSNGTGENNGIEIDKGAYATNNPSVTMNGVLTSDENKNVIYLAENGNLTGFTITNTESTTNKVFVTDDTLLITDKDNNIIFESSIPDKATANTTEKKVIVTLVVEEKNTKIAVDEGETITEEFLKSHIELKDNFVVDGFFTDSSFSKKFDFSKNINEDTTIYVKIKEEDKVVSNKEEKDETPKTGVEDYTVISILSLILVLTLIYYIREKRNRKK